MLDIQALEEKRISGMPLLSVFLLVVFVSSLFSSFLIPCTV